MISHNFTLKIYLNIISYHITSNYILYILYIIFDMIWQYLTLSAWICSAKLDPGSPFEGFTYEPRGHHWCSMVERSPPVGPARARIWTSFLPLRCHIWAPRWGWWLPETKTAVFLLGIWQIHCRNHQWRGLHLNKIDALQDAFKSLWMFFVMPGEVGTTSWGQSWHCSQSLSWSWRMWRNVYC